MQFYYLSTKHNIHDNEKRNGPRPTGLGPGPSRAVLGSIPAKVTNTEVNSPGLSPAERHE